MRTLLKSKLREALVFATVQYAFGGRVCFMKRGKSQKDTANVIPGVGRLITGNGEHSHATPGEIMTTI